MYYVVKIEYDRASAPGEYLITISDTKNRTLVAEQTICDCGIAFAKPAKTEFGDIVALTPENLNIEEQAVIRFASYTDLEREITDRFSITRTIEVAHSLFYLLKDGVCESLHGSC